MKKTIVSRKDVYPNSTCGDNCYELYFDINQLDDGWMITSEGDPYTTYDFEREIDYFTLEDDEERVQQTEEDLKRIEAIIADPRTPLEEITDEDIEYVNEWLDIWGCEPIEK